MSMFQKSRGRIWNPDREFDIDDRENLTKVQTLASEPTHQLTRDVYYFFSFGYKIAGCFLIIMFTISLI